MGAVPNRLSATESIGLNMRLRFAGSGTAQRLPRPLPASESAEPAATRAAAEQAGHVVRSAAGHCLELKRAEVWGRDDVGVVCNVLWMAAHSHILHIAD